MGEKDSQRLTTLTITGLYSRNVEVSPLGSTALITAISIPSNMRLETSRLGPMMTGPTRTEDLGA